MGLNRHGTALVLAAAVFAGQAATSLLLPPTAGDNAYRGTTGDIVNELLFAAGMVLLAGALLLLPARGSAGWAGRGIALGCLLLALTTIATVAAGEERGDAFFVLGFVLAAAGAITATAITRSPVPALLLLAIVLSLAFYDRAGAITLAGALALAAHRSRDAELLA